MNNEQVIEYISANSNHPHAAMIVKQLLTGWEVEFLSPSCEWLRVEGYQFWNPGTQYRLVKPKMKPAYRVFRHKGSCLVYTQIRSENGKVSDLDINDTIIFLTDWTEYDPEPKKWPTPLVERIAAIDIEAAEWIVDHWDELLEDKYSLGGNYFRGSRHLVGMFLWEPSEHGDKFWRDISKKLGEM